MKAIFNRKCVLVGWYDPRNNNVFGKEMQWIGFTKNGDFFSTTAQWFGGFRKGTYLDKSGKPVAWIEGNAPMGTNSLTKPTKPMTPLCPLRPLQPMTPIRPLRPLTPLGGWSTLDWSEYVDQFNLPINNLGN